MNCKRAEKLPLLSFDGRLGEKAGAVLNDHLERCFLCRQKEKGYREILPLLRVEASEPLPCFQQGLLAKLEGKEKSAPAVFSKRWAASGIAASLGLLGGIWSERYFFHKERGANIARAQRDSRHLHSLEHTTQDLELSAEQQEQIKKTFVKPKDFRSDAHSRLTKIPAELKRELDGMLIAEQRKKFEEMIQNYLLKRKEAFEKRKENLKRQNSAENPKGDTR